MIHQINKNEKRKKRHAAIRMHLSGNSDKPRLNVYKSLKHIYAQIIDDEKGITLVSFSTMTKNKNADKLTKTEAATLVGKMLAEKATKAGIQNVVFDRSGYIYTGRVKALAEGARDGGLKF